MYTWALGLGPSTKPCKSLGTGGEGRRDGKIGIFLGYTAGLRRGESRWRRRWQAENIAPR